MRYLIRNAHATWPGQEFIRAVIDADGEILSAAGSWRSTATKFTLPQAMTFLTTVAVSPQQDFLSLYRFELVEVEP